MARCAMYAVFNMYITLGRGNCFTPGSHTVVMMYLAASKYSTGTVGWSDLALFAVFENGRIAADQVYFVYSIEKIGKFDRVQHTPHKALIFTNSQTP